MEKAYLGLDLGTTNVKAALIGQQSGLMESATREYKTWSQGNWVEQSPEDWWENTKIVIREVFQAAEGKFEFSLAGIGLSGQMHGLVLLDNQGRLLRRAITWSDSRASQECELIDARIGRERLISITGNRTFPGATLPLLLWVKHNEGDLYQQCTHILSPKDYIRYRLTGSVHTDPVDASGTLMFDVKRRAWSGEILEALELDENLLPNVLSSEQVDDLVLASVAAELGIERVPVVAGAGDQGTGALGNSLVNTGEAFITVGTGGQVLTSLEEPLIDSAGRLQTLCHVFPQRWLLMGATLAAGLSLRWFRDTFVQERENAYEKMNALAEQVSPGAEGLFFMPYIVGERAPHFDAEVRGAFIGAQLSHSMGHFVRAVLEGVAYSLNDCMNLLEDQGVKIHKVGLVGGGSQSRLWAQIFASVFNRDIHITTMHDAPLLGAARLAYLGTELNGSFADLTIPGASSVVRPVETAVPVYQENYEKYRRLYGYLRPHYHSS